MLLLKIPLESPGVLKNSTKETGNSTFDEASRDNFIGLVTLFVFLLHSNALKYQHASPEVPFDVVSLFQCQMEEDLFLVVGVSEDERRSKKKSKRTKLGSYFFHAVSQFLNSNSLEKLLSRIAPTNSFMTESSIPGHGKLSSFINIMPDGNALMKLLASKQSLTIQSSNKQLRNFSDLDSNPISFNDHNDEEVTCLLLENINNMPPRSVAAILKNLYNQSLEIVGLKLGYVPSSNIFTSTQKHSFIQT